jgi:hypothetical protein
MDAGHPLNRWPKCRVKTPKLGRRPNWGDAQIGETPKLGRRPNWGDAKIGETPKLGRRPNWGDAQIGETPKLGRRPNWGDAQIGETPKLGRRPNWASLQWSLDINLMLYILNRQGVVAQQIFRIAVNERKLLPFIQRAIS